MVARSLAVRDARRRSVGDRSRARAGQGRACTPPRSRSWTSTRRRPTVPRKTSRRGFTDQVSEPGVESRRHGALLPRRRQQELRRDHLSLYGCGPEARARSCADEESFWRLQPTADWSGRVDRGRHAAHRSLDARCRRPAHAHHRPQSAARALQLQQAGVVLFRQRRRRPPRRAALQARRLGRERQGPGDHVDLREDDAGTAIASTRAIRCSSATATRC